MQRRTHLKLSLEEAAALHALLHNTGTKLQRYPGIVSATTAEMLTKITERLGANLKRDFGLVRIEQPQASENPLPEDIEAIDVPDFAIRPAEPPVAQAAAKVARGRKRG